MSVAENKPETRYWLISFVYSQAIHSLPIYGQLPYEGREFPSYLTICRLAADTMGLKWAMVVVINVYDFASKTDFDAFVKSDVANQLPQN